MGQGQPFEVYTRLRNQKKLSYLHISIIQTYYRLKVNTDIMNDAEFFTFDFCKVINEDKFISVN